MDPTEDYGNMILQKAQLLAHMALKKYGYEGAVAYWTSVRDNGSSPGTFSHMFDTQVVKEIDRLHKEAK